MLKMLDVFDRLAAQQVTLCSERARSLKLQGYFRYTLNSSKIKKCCAISSRGDFRYDLYTCRFNAQLFIEILRRFTKGLHRPCLIIVDGHPVHRANVVKDFIAASSGKIEIYFLPPYAPDLNPDEFVWNHVKRHGLSKKPPARNESLTKRVARDLAAIGGSPRLVRSFFRAKSVAYISA
jgi:transposase